LLAALLFAVLVPVTAHARFDGIAQGGSGCGGCHGNAATGTLSVSVSGPAAVLISSTNSYTLTIVNPGGYVGSGLSVETDSGTLVSTETFTKILSSTVTHTDASVVPPAGTLGNYAYNFDFTAPGIAGLTTLAFSGLVHDGGLDADKNSQDIWNVGSFGITTVIPEPTTGLLVSLGLGMLAVVGRRRK
jgi:hypothetical protein